MTSAAAALPNSRTIGGAGTGVGGGLSPPEDEALLADEADEALDADDALEAEEPLEDQPLLLDA